MSPEHDVDTSPLFLTHSTNADFEQLCNLDVLGLQDPLGNDQQVVYEEFKKQLERSNEGWYQTRLPWKAKHFELPANKTGSLKILQQLLRKLEREDNYVKYDSIIKKQLQEGIVERAPEVATRKEFYIPHKPVVRHDAESTKLKVVYDASAKRTG